MVWYSHLLKNFPQFVLIHTVKGFGTVNKAKVYVFLELSCFFDDPRDIGNLICVNHKLWKILKEIGVPEHLTCLLRSLYSGQEETVRT